MDDNLYTYDPELKQYRRRFPKETIKAPDAEMIGATADIYSSSGKKEEEEDVPGRRRPQSTPPEKAKRMFWICFFLVSLLWAYLLYQFVWNDTVESGVGTTNPDETSETKPSEGAAEEPRIQLRP